MKCETVVWIAIGIVILYMAFRIIGTFFSPLFFAFVTAYALYPVHTRLSEKIGSKTSATLLLLILLSCGIGTLLLLVYTLTPLISEAYEYLRDAERLVSGLKLPLGLSDAISSITTQMMGGLQDFLLSFTFSIPKYLLQLVVYLSFVYFFLVRGRELVDLLRFQNERLNRIIERGNLTLQALIRAWLLLNIAKGILMTLGFLIFRVSDLPTALLAGLLTVFFSFVPLFEGWMIWVVGAFYLFRAGRVLTALAFAIYGFIFVSPLPDFTIRPRIVAREAKFNEIIVLIGMIGGTWGLGLKGLIIGPIVLNVAIEILREWKSLKGKEVS
ncbi:AI-2E family transporter [Pyrococcus yayanosii]|uniref:Permease n=1 Tax=Pyrococcus yayanosii (strain CH1 / JCM 16557) TaxID=529709 RepID=F8AHF4_PYRYC|nr:AI-2E family transporter [Pyrococcus yayanosii]AEH24151.1 hypothetical protein PYCH_04610 [Pyrococcus yayanosii CH1]